MSGDRINYGCVALLGTGKVGKLTPDADGYYEVVLGGLNVTNSGGAYYPLKSAKSLFENSSSLMRRIETGACRGEYGHPKMQPGQDKRSWISRVSTIYEDNICCHFRDVRLEDYKGRETGGEKIVAVLGYVKPSGPRGSALGESLDNPKENVCFSVRSLTDDRVEGGRMVKHMRSIITWDYVNEPGIAIAKKWNSPSLESLDDTSFTMAHLEAAAEAQHGLGMESNGVSMESIFVDFGWKKQSTSGLILPPSARW